MIKKTLSTVAVLGMGFGLQAQFISEFEPNPAGPDPTDSTIELSGTPLASFTDWWLVSIENDSGGALGLVDRAASVSGSFDANGIAVVTVPDLENPTFTLILTDSFTGTIGTTDIDPADDGTLDLSAFGTIVDAIGVSDEDDDNSLLYGSALGGSDVFYNGQFEPLSIFRDSVTNDLYNTVTIDFNTPSQRIGIFDSSGSGIEVDAGLFTGGDPLATTFGSVNPTTVPEPGTYAALFGLLGLGLVLWRRRRS
jgi:hypothetical protein